MRTLHTDVVVVGARPAGASTAITLVKHGHRVIAIDQGHFPSDTLSTHIMTPQVVATTARLGALDRLLATGAPPLHSFHIYAEDFEPECPYETPEGFDFGISVRRPDFDSAMLETAREAGVDVLESTKAIGPVWAGGRLAGIRARDRSGEEFIIRARAVVGADGRHSTVASWVGSEQPYRIWPNQRGMVWMYFDDPRPVRDSWLMTRVGDTIGFHFPCNDGALVLLMPPVADIEKFRADPEGMWTAKLGMLPRLRERLVDAHAQTKQRLAEDLSSYFRISSGQGWALVGDAGHFKDPVIGHGMHDALVWGSALGEKLARALNEDDESVDRALRSYEHERDRGVLASLYLAGRFTRTHSLAAPEAELWRELESNANRRRDFGNSYTRTIPLEPQFSVPKLTKWAVKSLMRSSEDRAGTASFVAAELQLKVGYWYDRSQLALGRRARANKAARCDTWPDEMLLEDRASVMRNTPRTTGYHGKGDRRPPADLEAARDLVQASMAILDNDNFTEVN